MRRPPRSPFALQPSVQIKAEAAGRSRASQGWRWGSSINGMTAHPPERKAAATYAVQLYVQG